MTSPRALDETEIQRLLMAPTVRLDLGSAFSLRNGVMETVTFYEHLRNTGGHDRWIRRSPYLVAPNDGRSRAALLRQLADMTDHSVIIAGYG